MTVILEQIFLGLLFLLSFFISVTVPGLAITRKLNLDPDRLEEITLSSIFGMVLFTLVAYFLSWINLRFLMYVFPASGILLLFKFRNLFKGFRLQINHKKIFGTLLILGMLGQVAVNAPSGFPYKDGIYFYSSHGHDGIWHIALMEEMKKAQFPFQNPELAGQKLQNYHFFVDLLMSEFGRLFHFTSLDIYFRFMPVIFSLLLGLGSFILVKNWVKSEAAGIWAMFFTYFAGSFGYLLYIPTHRSLGGESIFWVSQTQSVLGNPPHAAAFIITLAFLLLLFKYLQSRKIALFLVCAVLGGAVIEFKVYAGVLILGGLLVLGLAELLLKREVKSLMLFAVTLIIAFVIYFPNSANSTDFLIWQPWWYIRTMVVAPDRLNWLDLELRRQTYIAEGNWKRVIQLETEAFLIFLFGNLGMRFLGLLTVFKQLKIGIFKDRFNLFFLVVTTAAFLIPVFFLQKGVAWNSIQFNQYFLLFFGLLAGITTAEIISFLKNQSAKTLVAVVIVILAIPTQIGLLWQFYSGLPLSKVSYKEQQALNFLKEQPEGIILTAPFNKYEKGKYLTPPIPIYAWSDTGYVPAFSHRQTLISDEEQVNIMGYDAQSILKDREEAFMSQDVSRVNSFLKKYKIDYVYLSYDQKFAASSSLLNMDLIYQNKDTKVFKVRR